MVFAEAIEPVVYEKNSFGFVFFGELKGKSHHFLVVFHFVCRVVVNDSHNRRKLLKLISLLALKVQLLKTIA